MLQDKYKTTVMEILKKELGDRNVLALPRIEKVTLNVGLSAKKDAKFIEEIVRTLTVITGQQPVKTLARKSEAGFKIREGQVVGAMVTIRGARMWDFLDKLVNVTFPRVRDFRGIKKSSVDRTGNFHYGFREHLAFPEVSPDAIDTIHGLQVSITTTAADQKEGMLLMKALGFPFKKSST
jgi:large subunit ribosomal protein L5